MKSLVGKIVLHVGSMEYHLEPIRDGWAIHRYGGHPHYKCIGDLMTAGEYPNLDEVEEMIEEDTPF